MNSIAQIYRRFFYTMCSAGYFPPLMESLLPSIWIKIMSHAFGGTMYCLYILHITLMYYYMFSTELPSVLLLALFRRNLVMVYTLFKLSYMFYNRKQLAKLLMLWTDDTLLVGTTDDFHIRQQIFDEKIRKSAMRWILPFFTFAATPQVYSILFMINRHAKGAQFAIYPHNVDSSIHFLLVGLSSIMFYASVTVFLFDVLCGFLLNMLSCHISYLQNNFGDLFGARSIDDEGIVDNSGSLKRARSSMSMLSDDEDLSELKRKVNKWIQVHIRTVRWAKDIEKYFSSLLTVKFLYLSVYAAMVVYSLPHYVKNGQYTDVMLNIGYCSGLFSSQFYLTRIMDEIAHMSTTLTQKSYKPELFAHPLPLQKIVSIVSTCTMRNPIQFKGLYIFYDNTDNFLTILQLAYKGLTLLFQMDF